MVDPSHVGHDVKTSGGATLSLVIPSAAAVGDRAYVAWHANITSFSMTVPAGWTEEDFVVAGSNRLAVLRRDLQAGDPGGTANFSLTGIAKQSGALFVVRNADAAAATVLDTTFIQGDTDAIYAAPVLSAPVAALVYEVFFERSATTPSTGATVAGATKLSEAYGSGGAASSCVLALDGVQPAGSVGGDAATWNVFNAAHGAATVAARAAAAAPGPGVTVWNGSAEVPATVQGVWDGASIVPAASVEVR